MKIAYKNLFSVISVLIIKPTYTLLLTC